MKLIPEMEKTVEFRFKQTDLRTASELQLQAVYHCSLLIMQSGDPDQALGKEK